MKKIITTILFLLILLAVSTAQDRWVKIYHEDDDAPRRNIINTYDKGILITIRQKPNWPRYTYLIKTDINGEILWEKTLGDGYNVLINGGLDMDADGNIYFGGTYGLVGYYGEPIIMKLNACGAKEWCKIFDLDPDVSRYSLGLDLCVADNGDVAFLYGYANEDLIHDRVCLARFSDTGDLLWKNCYNINDTVAMGNDSPRTVITTPDNGFLITGFAQYSNPGDSASILCPYYVKADSMGEMEWYTVAGFLPIVVKGEGWTTTVSPDSNYYYSSIRHYIQGQGFASGLLKMDMQGNVIDIYDLAPAADFGILYDARFIDDTTLMGNYSTPFAGSGNPRAVLFDTVGNVLNDEFLIETNTMAATEITHDGKLLFYSEALDDNDEYDAYLFKLNQDLQSDSIYSQWYNYDSLCPYQITNDTIPIEGCGVIVGTSEISKSANEKFEVFPNPASKSFVVKSAYLENGGILQLINMQGQNVMLENVPSGTINYEVDVTALTKGIYLVRFKSDKGKEVTAKLVVGR